MTDTFRKEYKPLSESQKLLILEIKDKAEALLILFNSNDVSIDHRQMAIAKTNLEQAVMWAVKAIS